jgi:hypothetical protein
MSYLWGLPVVAVVLLALGVLLWRPKRRTSRTTPLTRAKQRFHVQRERLEMRFVQLAAAHVRPNAPRWADCTFDDDVAYVRNRTTGELSAFVAVTIAAEESDVSPYGASDAVGNLQAGTAVFRFDRDHWETDGRAILNLSPSEVVYRSGNDLEIVSEDFAHRA